MSEWANYVVLVLGLGLLLVLWDLGKRHIAARANTAALGERIDKLDRELERCNQQIQAVIGKLTNTGAAVASRLPARAVR